MGINDPEKEFQEAAVALKNGYASMAYDLFLRIAEKGDPRAQFLVGRLLEDGRGVPREPEQSAQWYRRAATQGHTEAQVRLGFLYLGGGVIPRNDAEALRWFRLAAEQGGHSMAQAYLCSLYAEGGSTLPADKKLSMEWCQRAAEQGVPAAQTMLGFHYALGTPPDLVTARRWFEQAARQGYTSAVKALTELDRGITPTPVTGMPPTQAAPPAAPAVTRPGSRAKPTATPTPNGWE
ncbi:MAG: sel1 repeat family protein [Magnetococcales bacterium]|nr:sel1 repeat family protein [Magnetococcales bacterium]